MASVVQEGSFLRILFPRGVHVVVGGDDNDIVVVTATVVASFGLCIHVCRYAETPQLNWAARWDPSDPQQNLIRPLLTMILSLVETERNSPGQVR